MSRIITREEVKSHNTEKTIWIIINNEVYDVTKFLEEHPGGADSLMDFAGVDGTQGFEDVGHSEDAREMMKQFKIGKLAPGDHTQTKPVAACALKIGENDFLVCQAASCPREPKADNPNDKTWRTFDGTRERPKIPKTESKTPSTPRAERRVQTIVVPRESSSTLKWALLALGAAIIIGIAVKKYSS